MILTFGLLSPDKGIEHVIDALPAILARYPETVYIVLGATHPHVKERHGETYRSCSSIAPSGSASTPHDLSRPLREPGRAHRVPRRRGHLHHAVLSTRSRSPRARWPTRSAPGKAVISTPVPVRARAPRRRPRDPRAVEGPAGDRARGHRPARRRREAARPAASAPPHGRDMLWPAVARRYVQSFERARAEHTDRRRDGLPGEDARERPPELPELNLEHLRLMTDQTGMLQHAAFSVPRYDDGYCLDDNARALLLMALIEDAGTEDGTGRARARVALPGLREPRVQPGARALPELHVVLAPVAEECGSEDSHGRALWALGTVVGRSGDPGRQSLGGELFHAALPAVADVHEPARVGVRAARHRRVPARVPGRQQRAGDAHDARGAAPRPLPADEHARLAVVRGPGHLLQRAPVAGADRVGSLDGARRDDRRGDAIARVAGLDPALGGRLLRAHRLERLLSSAADQQGVVRPAAGRGVRDGLGLSRGAARDRRRALGGARAPRVQAGSSGRTTCSSRSTTRRPAAAATACTPIA